MKWSVKKAKLGAQGRKDHDHNQSSWEECDHLDLRGWMIKSLAIGS